MTYVRAVLVLRHLYQHSPTSMVRFYITRVLAVPYARLGFALYDMYELSAVCATHTPIAALPIAPLSTVVRLPQSSRGADYVYQP
jgi:hypothetical protein